MRFNRKQNSYRTIVFRNKIYCYCFSLGIQGIAMKLLLQVYSVKLKSLTCRRNTVKSQRPRVAQLIRRWSMVVQRIWHKVYRTKLLTEVSPQFPESKERKTEVVPQISFVFLARQKYYDCQININNINNNTAENWFNSV